MPPACSSEAISYDMKTFLRIALFIALFCLSALSLLLLLPFLREGASWQDLPLFVATVLAALGLAAVWWLAVGRSIRMALVGWIVLLPPVAAHGFAAVSLVAANVRAAHLESAVRVENYREEPIMWPGFDGPLGIRITLELVHPPHFEALVLPPEIRMGPDLALPRTALESSLSGGRGYFSHPEGGSAGPGLSLLRTVLFQRVYENAAAVNDYYRWSAAARLAKSGRTALTYHLLPGMVDFLPDRGRICLDSRSPGIPACAPGQSPETGCSSRTDRQDDYPAYYSGSDLSALWLAAGSWNMVADLSDHLTAAMRRHSDLQGRPARWTAIQRRLEPRGLADAGYRLCPAGRDSHTRFRTCYCRPG